MESKHKKGILIIGLFIVGICIGIAGILKSGGISLDTNNNGHPIDLSFSNFEITGEGANRYITSNGEYIAIYDSYSGNRIEAQLDVGSIKKGTFTFQVQTPDLNKEGAFQLNLNSGDEIVMRIVRLKMTGGWFFQYSGCDYIFLLNKDTNWHCIEISFEINGDNSIVSVKIDGIITIDSAMFSTDKISIDTIQIYSGKYYVPNLTYLKLEELIKFK